MSSLAHSKTQVYPGAGSAAEDPTKSYKGFKFIFAIMWSLIISRYNSNIVHII